uniref:Uncharacterized protein n=1 Tax=Rhizophora mucronata TaxID=61149 RepID=A0A2P2R4V1_RHIMU
MMQVFTQHLSLVSNLVQYLPQCQKA